MPKILQEGSYRLYWLTWAFLLILTLVMLGTGSVPLGKAFLVSLLLLAMLAKAGLIGAHFMHLRFEKLSLVFVVTLGILATAAALFLLIAFDGVRVQTLSSH